MIGNIPNLWPELQSDEPVITPKAILQRQAMVITEKTENRVQGVVVSRVIGRDFLHTFELVVPDLDAYRHFIVGTRHSISNLFPCRALFTEQDNSGTECNSEKEFLGAVKKALCDPRTQEVVTALVAQSGVGRGGQALSSGKRPAPAGTDEQGQPWTVVVSGRDDAGAGAGQASREVKETRPRP